MQIVYDDTFKMFACFTTASALVNDMGHEKLRLRKSNKIGARRHNRAADKLANLAMNRKGNVVDWNQQGMDSIWQYVANDSNACLNVRFDGGYRPTKQLPSVSKGNISAPNSPIPLMSRKEE